MKKILALIFLLTLCVTTSSIAHAQESNVWNYKATWVRYGKGSEGIKTMPKDVKWDSINECNLSVSIDLDNNTMVISDDYNAVHSMQFVLLEMNTDSNPAKVLMSGFDICRMDLAAVNWHLYKGQSHYLYLIYDSGYAIEFTMQRLA